MDTAGSLPFEAVIFDLGQVLIEVHAERAYAAVGRLTGLDKGEVPKRLALETELFDAFETGLLSASEFHQELCARLDCRFSYDEFRAIWNRVLGEEITPTANLCRSLHRNQTCRVAILSNTNEVHADHMRGRWPLLSELPMVFMSNEIGFRKPNARAYGHVLERLNVSAERTVFVDDLKVNVDAAEQLGIHGIWATSVEAVQRGLKNAGLIE